MRRCSVVGFLLVMVAVIAGCEGSATPSLDRFIAETVAPACAGQAVAGSGSVSAAGTNHVVMLDSSGHSFAWTSWIPTEWQPQSTADTELVTCVTAEPIREVIEVCPYYGSDITRYSVTREFSVHEPSSGDEVADFWITAEPRSCRPQEDISLTELEGVIDHDLVTAHLAGLVAYGLFVDPDAPGNSLDPWESTAPSPHLRSVELRDAINQGLLTATGTGIGLESLAFELESATDEDIEVSIEAGTILDPGARATQSMVVTTTESVELPAWDTTALSLDVACVQMHQDQPDGDDSFVVREADASGELERLLAYEGFVDEPFRVQQFAVWTITSNPKRNDYVPLGTSLSVFGSGPDAEELEAITDLFESAGLDPRDYRALR